MRYDKIKNEFYKLTRQKYVAATKKNAISIFNSNPIFPSNADGTMRFRQNNDLFYLTGIDQEETILVLFPDFQDENYREILFIKETNDHIRIWEGSKLSKEDAIAQSGIKNIFWVSQFDSILDRIIQFADCIYLNINQSASDGNQYSKDFQFLNVIKQKYPLHSIERAAPILESLRMVKETEEVNQIKKAVEITEKMFVKAANCLKPNVFEYEIEAEITYELLKNGSRWHAFEPIIASGKNACVLHYVENNAICKENELVLIDMGAEYGNYNADFTRTIPVSGKFSKRQKEVYQAVLNVMRFARLQMFIGNTFKKLNLDVGQKMESELYNLGLLSQNDLKFNAYDSEKPAYKKYFPHGVAHFLGLDVHDVGNKFCTFQAGMILTNEPGIYIQEEGIGIRLENDILITEEGNFDLFHHVPIEIEDIENLMSK
jgi:Xaa-Pro aminopeptidase